MPNNRAFPEISLGDEEKIKEQSRELCRSDLHYLAKDILGYHRVTDHCHVDMAKDIDTPNYKFKLLLWPRGHFKSTVGTESRSIQKILRNPSERILITNAKLDNSRKFKTAIANQFHYNAKFRWLWREWWINKFATPYQVEEKGDKLDWVTRDTQDEFKILRPYEGREASITTGAVDSSLVSQHFSTIIADDLINRDYVRTVEMVEKSKLYFKDLLDLLDPDGCLEIIGTRWSFLDLYSWIIDEFGGNATFMIPKGYTGVKPEVLNKSKKADPNTKDWLISIRPCYEPDGVTPIFPEEFTVKVLEDLKTAKGPYEYGAQYELNPVSEANQKFKEEWFNELSELPSAHNMSVCITVDPAKSLRDDADYSVIVVCGYDEKNRMFLLDGINDKLTVDELPEILFDTVRYWTSKAGIMYPVGFEAIGFQETYVSTMTKMMFERDFFFMIEPIKRKTSIKKEDRILGLVPRIKNGFYMPRTMMKRSVRGHDYDFISWMKWQFLKFPFSEHDDITDAMADQLLLVHYNSLPAETQPIKGVKKPDFIHRSIIEDRSGGSRRMERYSDAVRSKEIY